MLGQNGTPILEDVFRVALGPVALLVGGNQMLGPKAPLAVCVATDLVDCILPRVLLGPVARTCGGGLQAEMLVGQTGGQWAAAVLH